MFSRSCATKWAVTDKTGFLARISALNFGGLALSSVGGRWWERTRAQLPHLARYLKALLLGGQCPEKGERTCFVTLQITGSRRITVSTADEKVKKDALKEIPLVEA